MSGNLRLRVGAGLAATTAVLLAVATVGALELRPDRRQDGAEVLVTAGSSSGDLFAEPAPTTTTSAAPTTVAPATTAPPAAPPTTLRSTVNTPPAARPPAGAAAAPPGPPPTIASRQTFTITPNSGSGTTSVTAGGTGCTGASASASVRIDDPGGRPVSGDGGSASADGAWRFSFSVGGNAAPGAYTVNADCRSGAQVLFVYPPQVFTVTG